MGLSLAKPERTNNSALFSVIGTGLGAVGGAIIGGGWNFGAGAVPGAMAGAGIGAKAGQLVGGIQDQSNAEKENTLSLPAAENPNQLAIQDRMNQSSGAGWQHVSDAMDLVHTLPSGLRDQYAPALTDAYIKGMPSATPDSYGSVG